jgi:hypothetical protein
LRRKRLRKLSGIIIDQGEPVAATAPQIQESDPIANAKASKNQSASKPAIEVIDLLWSDDEEEAENIPPPRKKRATTSTVTSKTTTRAAGEKLYPGAGLPDKKSERETKVPPTASSETKQPGAAKKVNSVSVRLDSSSLPSDTVPSVLLETGATIMETNGQKRTLATPLGQLVVLAPVL